MPLPSILPLPDPSAARETYSVAADKLRDGDPRQAVANTYSDPSGQFHCGIWEAEPATWTVNYSEHEYCEILAGRIRMIREDGADTREVTAGDRFVIPAGWRGTWQVLEAARKVYVIFEPRLS